MFCRAGFFGSAPADKIIRDEKRMFDVSFMPNDGPGPTGSGPFFAEIFLCHRMMIILEFGIVEYETVLSKEEQG